MTNQLLMNFRPTTRKTDPLTSKAAEIKVTNSGTRKSHCLLVLEVLKENNGSTYSELAARMDGDFYRMQDICHKRLPDLASAGYAKRGTVRICKIVNSPCQTWWIVN